ncbi:MAG: hypothetical protein EBV06_11760 [Planctomycetia bacterium]|nr:hypothetical protein [Planctomycetia bacterium]
MRATLMLFLVAGVVHGQQILREGFESKGPYWKQGSSDAVFKLIRHALTDETAQSGQRSEHIRLQIERGSYIHYVFDIPRAPVNDELTVGLWIKSNRPGVQLMCRVVLPRERDPKDPSRNLTCFLRCEPYNSTRWKPLPLVNPVKRLREQQQLLNSKLGRDVSTAGAYVDQVVLNLYDGPGTLDVWIDDLEIGPVVGDPKPEGIVAVPTVRPTPGSLVPRGSSEVRFAGQRLMIDNKPFMMRAIRHTGMPLSVLNMAGFNTICLDETAPTNRIEEASKLGFKLVPTLERRSDDLQRRMNRFMVSEAVLAWDLGGNLDADQFTSTAGFARMVQQDDSSRLLIADVWDGFLGYARGLDGTLMGTHRWPLFTSLELANYREWLSHRRKLTRTNYAWTWVQTHPQEWFLKMAYPKENSNGFREPVGPLPEQIRLLSYIALAAGYRGLAFWSDRFLADSHQGRDRLLGLALLNQELKLLEKILQEVTDEVEWVDTSHPDIKAAIFRIPRNVLVLPIWVGKGAQFVPGQSALVRLDVYVPAAPITTTRGAIVKLENFSLATAVVLTSDMSKNGMVVHLQTMQQGMAKTAAQWLHDQAKEELDKVEQIDAALIQAGVGLPDAAALLEKAKKSLEQSRKFRTDGQHSEGYAQAEVALRSLRVLMRAHWERAVRDLDTPTASPFAVSFYTLPLHHELLEELRGLKAGSNVLPYGDFEVPVGQSQPGWTVQEVPSLDPVTTEVRRVSQGAHGGSGQCVMLAIRPKDPRRVPAALERTFVALHSPAVKLPPGSLVRVSGYIKIPAPITGSADGALLYDSAGGEPLAVRLTGEQKKWKSFSLYRRVPPSGQIHVTLAMSGLGAVYFDDVRIEPLTR